MSYEDMKDAVMRGEAPKPWWKEALGGPPIDTETGEIGGKARMHGEDTILNNLRKEIDSWCGNVLN